MSWPTRALSLPAFPPPYWLAPDLQVTPFAFFKSSFGFESREAFSWKAPQILPWLLFLEGDTKGFRVHVRNGDGAFHSGHQWDPSCGCISQKKVPKVPL